MDILIRILLSKTGLLDPFHGIAMSACEKTVKTRLSCSGKLDYNERQTLYARK